MRSNWIHNGHLLEHSSKGKVKPNKQTGDSVFVSWLLHRLDIRISKVGQWSIGCLVALNGSKMSVSLENATTRRCSAKKGTDK
jgi:hypothetical protein